MPSGDHSPRRTRVDVQDQVGRLPRSGPQRCRADPATLSQRQRPGTTLSGAPVGTREGRSTWLHNGRQAGRSRSIREAELQPDSELCDSGATFVFFAFDLFRLEGKDLTQRPLSERRNLLRMSLRTTEAVQLSESFSTLAAQMLELVLSHGLEGVVAKRPSSTYEQGGRTVAWTKLRVELSQELVIGGYTPSTHGFDAVLVGFYRGDRLHFCASVRAGFVPARRRALYAQLTPLEAEVCPFVSLPEASAGRWGQGLTSAKMKNCTWLRPEAVAQFRFLECIPNDHLRHASFVAVREDNDPRVVVKEDKTTVERKAPQGGHIDRKRKRS